ncbi:multidrug resistance efflux pump [Rhodobium orientis]|uniref:Efflux transporter periplasmic adaptor subunit n=1 Tax=Rhodobium orientis TaxID=34017 RepID=A0A327JKX0_9HYPH|nr:efflux RND transporter periplasmic adaptor subunit [Rhodobium orientis]MBB4302069.1 multidrug resistance efflux pump [Rhodobium orientis]MBK5951340.1 efflux transporter periplasmic adaptor subunit [Rhodobium orientis]RAI25953.1 efflux transporter periplasmic adaptor subunit [Rhodobium orientis]
MILFLTLCYIAVVFLLVKLRILPASRPMKLSPIGFMLLAFVFLFVPMQWGAPAGGVQVLRHTVQIVPNVAGQVIEVPVRPNTPVRKGDVLFRIDPAQYQAKVDQLTAQLGFATLRLGQFTQLERKQAGSKFQVEEAEANVEGLKAQLANARWELDNTVVTAPADGFVTNVALRPGARVAALPLAPVMAFVDTSETVVAMQVQQIHLRHIAPGQPAEVTFKAVPGEVYSATVEQIVPATVMGQVAPSGAAATTTQLGALPFAVRLKLDDPSVADALPAGTNGGAAIYTSSVRPAHIIRRVMLRMDAWLNYVVPI